MAQLVIAAAGAAFTTAIGIGPQAGWIAGSLIGSAFGATQRSQGPRLTDLKVTGTEDGAVIPYIQGAYRVAPCRVAWSSDRREIATTTEVGKGGGGAEVTTYTYEVDVLLLLADNVLAGFSRIWVNGKLVYNALSTASAATLAASAASEYWSRVTFYGGGPTQLPDPVYEAAVTTAKACAYRGRATLFIEGLQLGSSGQMPNITVEVFTNGTVATAINGYLLHFDDFANPTTFVDDAGNTWARTAGSAGNITVASSPAKFSGGALRLTNPDGTLARISTTFASAKSPANNVFTVRGWLFWNGSVDTQPMLARLSSTNDSSEVHIYFSYYLGGIQFVTQLSSAPYHTLVCGLTANTWTFIEASYDGTTKRLFAAGALQASATMAPGTQRVFHGASIGYNSGSPSGSVDAIDDAAASFGIAGNTANYPPPTGPLSLDPAVSIANVGTETLSNVVSRLCLRAGLTVGQFDVTALASITKPVRGMAVSQVTTTRQVLEMLAGAYYFEAVLVGDKITFVPLGGAPAATIPWADLGASTNAEGDPEPLALRVVNDLENPAQVALSYANADADYTTATEYSDRILTAQGSTATDSVPLAFTAAEAKGIADTRVAALASGRYTSTIALTQRYARLVPTDVLLVTDEDSSTYRLRITKRTEADGVLTFDTVADDATILSQSGISSSGYVGSSVVNAPADTVMSLLDVPILRDEDDGLGLYVAMKGATTPWSGGALVKGLDGLTYPDTVATVNEQAVMGTCTTTLGVWAGGNVFDETNTLTVNVGSGQLVSVTRDQVLDAGANAALVGSEIIQFRNATLVSAGVYTLSGLLRGRRGTESFTGTHAASEAFTLLRTAGLRRVTLATPELGAERHYKAVTLGRAYSTAADVPFTCQGISLKPWSPVDLRGSRASGDLTATWSRRTRLATNFSNGTVPLGEASEAYVVEVWNSTYTTLVRTISGLTSASALYTAAQQTTDFGSAQAVVYLRVYQLSATVGRGHVLQGSV